MEDAKQADTLPPAQTEHTEVSQEATAQSSLQPVLSDSQLPLPPSAKTVGSAKQSGKRLQVRKSIEDQPIIPILTRDTANQDTYDIDFLLGSQKQLKARHRFATHLEASAPAKPEAAPSTNFVRKNIQDTLKPKTDIQSLGSTLSFERLLSSKRTMKPKQVAQLFDRLVTYKQHVTARCKQAKEEQMNKEIAKCTFAPELVTTTKHTRTKRKPEDLYYAGVAKTKEAHERQERLREELQQEGSSFRPELNQQSVRLLAHRGRDTTPVFEKLYGAHKTEIQNRVQKGTRSLSAERDDLTFKPSINKKSDAVTRGKKVDEMLYEDAQRRMERRKGQPSPSPTFESRVSTASEKVLSNKFEQDFRSAWGLFSASDVLQTQFVLRQLLQELRLESDTDTCTSKVWEMLEGTKRGGIRMKNLLSFLKVILRLKPGGKLTADRPAAEGKFGCYQGDEFVFSAKDVERIHKAFSGVYDSRLTAVKKKQTEQEYPFKPDISKARTSLMRSRSGSVSSRRNSLREEQLFTRSQKLLKA